MSDEPDNLEESETFLDKAKEHGGDAKGVADSIKNFRAEKAAASVGGVPAATEAVEGVSVVAVSGTEVVVGTTQGVTAAAGSGAAAGAAAGGTAAAAGGVSAAAGGTVAGVAGAAGSAVGAAAGTAGAVVAVAGDVKGLADSAKNRDAVGALDSSLRGVAVIATSVLATPAAGAIVSTALNTKPGRFLSKGISKIVVFAIAFLLAVFLTFVTSIVGSIITFTGLLNSAQQQCSSATTSASGIVANSTQQQVMVDIVSVAYSKGFGLNGAVLGVMTGLTESNLTNGEHDATQAKGTDIQLLSAGVFQQMPWYWAHEAWPVGTSKGSAAYNDPQYVNAAIADVTNTTYAAGKFFDKLNLDAPLKNGAWQKIDPWVVAQTIQVSAFSDGSNYKAHYLQAQTDVNLVIQQYPGIAASSGAASAAVATSSCSSGLSSINAASIILPPNGKTAFTTDTSIQIPNAPLAVSNAAQAVNADGLGFCSQQGCPELCDHLAGAEWGYSASGYATALVHWQTAVATGVAHPGSINVPIGALMFWDTGAEGHVAIYVGNGMVVSNIRNSSGSYVYEVAADWWSAHTKGYYGWAMPVFRGPKIPGSGF